MATASNLFKVLLLLNLLLAVYSQQVFETNEEHPEVEEIKRLYLPQTEYNDLVFNYDKNGTDWTGLCKNKNLPQSPYNLTNAEQIWKYQAKKFNMKTHKFEISNITVNQTIVDWKTQQFSFVTRYRNMSINQSMPVNNVTMLKLNVDDVETNGLFGFWAEEPKYIEKQPQSHVVQWSFDEIRSHYPSEHRWNNVSTDLELQLFHSDLLGQSLSCKAKKAAIVLHFNLASTESNNGFFDTFTTKTPSPDGDNGAMDISKLLDLASSMKSNISGYIGGDTMPPCTSGVCYYVYEKIFNITQEQLDYFKVDKIPFNARLANQGAGEQYKYTLRNKGFFVNDQE